MDTDEEKTDTIKTLIIEKIRQQRQFTSPREAVSEEDIRAEVEKYLREVCFNLPGENDPENNKEGVEFAKIMFCTQQDLHAVAVNKIVEMIMEERNDLVDYPHLRKKIGDAMTRNFRDLYDGVSYKTLETPKS